MIAHEESLLMELESAYRAEHRRYLKDEVGECGDVAGDGTYSSMALQRAHRAALRVVYGLGKEDA